MTLKVKLKASKQKKKPHSGAMDKKKNNSLSLSLHNNTTQLLNESCKKNVLVRKPQQE